LPKKPFPQHSAAQGFPNLLLPPHDALTCGGLFGQAALIFALHSEFALLLNSREPFADLDMALFVWVNRGEAFVDRDTISVWQVLFGSEGEPSTLSFQHYTKSKQVQ
jgi:hypothetical protein